MEGTGAVINFECGKMSLTDIGTVIRLQGASHSTDLCTLQKENDPTIYKIM